MKSEDIARKAEALIGYSRIQVNCAGDHAWCAQFVSEVLKACDIDMYDLSCSEMYRRMSKSEEWDEPESYPRAGDVIFFDWDHDSTEARPLDHVGIVVKYKDRVVTYINGNGSSADYVTEQQISVDSHYIAYWMRYVGDIGSSKPPDNPDDDKFSITLQTLRRGSKGSNVKALQRLLFADGYDVGPCGDDGDYGERTEKAVKRYQTDHSLLVDGVAGKETFTELLT